MTQNNSNKHATFIFKFLSTLLQRRYALNRGREKKVDLGRLCAWNGTVYLLKKLFVSGNTLIIKK